MSWNITNIILGFINTIAIPLLLHFILTKSKRPVYTRNSYLLTGSRISGENSKLIKAANFENQFNQLTKTEFRIWNNGRKSIRSTDLLIDDPFGIRCNGELIEVKYVTTQRILKSFDIEITGETLLFTFDSLPPNEGFLLEIIHTGRDDSLEIVGCIDDADRIRDQKKTHILTLISILLCFFLISSYVLIKSFEGMKLGGLFGLGFGISGAGIGLSRFALEMGIAGILSLLFLFLVMSINLTSHYVKLLPENIERLRIRNQVT